ncbi:MAG TPA: class 1 fructose-bisphosphatase [Candidatus Kapabacteria bacterium]|nr:class 1 fructose-bisphosphatase [Candidatus Kapabacteria bacterium]
MPSTQLITIERHIADQEHMHSEASGKFSRLLRDLMLAVRVIQREVRRAGLSDIFGLAGGKENIHGEMVKKLDVLSNDTIIRAMRYGGHLCAMASEESFGLIPIPDDAEKGSYVLLFDPLDGSSNIEVNAPIGTIFSVLHRVTPDNGSEGTMRDLLQPGYRQVAAGYALYGSSTVLVYTSGDGVDVFTYDHTLGEFLLSARGLRIPKRGRYYSINEGNAVNWYPGTRRYMEHLKSYDKAAGRPYSLRYIGTAVADIHRTLLHGGIFLYPSDRKSPNGKLRLMYEVNPLAMLIEQAGGTATDGRGRVLDVVPTDVHQRAPIICGSSEDVAEAMEFLAGDVEAMEAERAAP